MSLPSTVVPGILQRLRTETRLYHEALEQNQFNQDLTAGTLSERTTARFLAKMYGFLKPYEDHLLQYHLPPAWQQEHRYRAHLILADLGVEPEQPMPPLCPTLPPLDTLPRLLGAMYVMEGSTLGGQVIARQMAKAGISTRAYFTGYAERTGPLWKQFCQQLGEAATPENEDEIVLSAARTFQYLENWLNKES